MEDQLLLAKIIKQRNKSSFEELYNKYFEYSLRVATAIMGDKAEAADAVQEAFIRVYFNMDKFNLNKPFKPWFYKILINECRRILKKNSKSNLSYVSDYVENHPENIHEDQHKFEKYEDLYRAIQELDMHNKVPIILKYLGGFSEAEIAQILDINVNTLKSRLFKGRKKLKKKLNDSSKGRYYNE